MHAYPFLRVTSVVLSDNFNPSLLALFYLFKRRKRKTKMDEVPK